MLVESQYLLTLCKILSLKLIFFFNLLSRRVCMCSYSGMYLQEFNVCLVDWHSNTPLRNIFWLLKLIGDNGCNHPLTYDYHTCLCDQLSFIKEIIEYYHGLGCSNALHILHIHFSLYCILRRKFYFTQEGLMIKFLGQESINLNASSVGWMNLRKIL